MTQHGGGIGFAGAVRNKPLQVSKFVGILLALVLGVGGFFRIINATAIIGDPRLGDGQLLALVLIPLISLGLVALVFVETLVTAYRVVRSEKPVRTQLTERTGYTLIRGVEATIAVIGVLVMAAALPVLFAESTPAPAGVGVMLLLMVVGLGIFLASLLRSAAELFVYTDP